MRRAITIILAAAMLLSLCACGGGETNAPAEEQAAETAEETAIEPTPEPTAEPTPEPTEGLTEEDEAVFEALDEVFSWGISNYVDEFGDPTDKEFMRCASLGSFSNTATSDSDLTVIVCYDMAEDVFSFRLLEYGDRHATYFENEDCIIKIKDPDGTILEGMLFGTAPNGDLYLVRSHTDNRWLADSLYDSMCNGEDVRCIIEINSSKYNFTIRGDGFDDCLKAATYAAVNKLLARDDNIDVAVGTECVMVLRADGTVVAMGNNDDMRCDVSDWTDIVAMSVAEFHTVGLRSDGTVLAIGRNIDKGCDVGDWEDVVAVATDGSYVWDQNKGATETSHTVGLKSDGTVVATGNNNYGQCDVSDWTDIVAIAAGSLCTIGLRSDGTVVAVGWRWGSDGVCDASDWKDIKAVAASGSHAMGLRSDGTVATTGVSASGQCDVSDWTDIVAVAAGRNHMVGLRSDGTVVAVGDNEDGQCNVSDWMDIVDIAASDKVTVGLRSDGTIVIAGDIGGYPSMS